MKRPARTDPPAAAAPGASRRLRQFTARRKRPDCHHPADKRPDPRRQGGSYSRLISAEPREQWEDKPRFQGPALQTTHHCHRARSCLGPKHRRLIKVYCRFSPKLHSVRGRGNPSGIRSSGCSSALAAAALFVAPLPQRNLVSLPPQEKLPSTTETRGEANPDGTGRPRRRRLRAPSEAQGKSGASLDLVGWHRFTDLRENSPVYTAENG